MRSMLHSGKSVAILFAVYAIAISAVVIWWMPPLMGPDEPNHIRRADLITHGSLFGSRVKVNGSLTSGGLVEPSLAVVEKEIEPMKFHPEVKVRDLPAATLVSIEWGNSMETQAFPNTAVYPPIFYLPSAAGLALGQAMNLTVAKTLPIARALNAVACILVGIATLLLAGRARLLLFTVLLLPMSVAQFAIVTQDGLLIVTAALACALMVRGLSDGKPMSKQEVWGAAVCLTLVGMAKPPYVLFALLLLLVKSERHVWSRAGAAGAFATSCIWHLLMAAFVQTPLTRPDVPLNASAQVAYVAHHPAALASAVLHTALHSGAQFVSQFIGVLGWLDTLLPKPYYLVALLVLVAAIGASWTVDTKEGFSRPIWTVVILGLVKLGVYVALYVAYTPVGAALVDGIQGRYFLPVAAFLPVATVGPREMARGLQARNVITGLVLLFPVVSLVVVERALAARYWP